MEIEETIKRQCCNDVKGDLEPYNGKDRTINSKGLLFCKYCGQIWGVKLNIMYPIKISKGGSGDITYSEWANEGSYDD